MSPAATASKKAAKKVPPPAKPAEPKSRVTSRRYGATGRGYFIDGDKVPGVTTILNALPKQLKQWAADCSANYAVEHWDELTEKSLTKKLDAIRYAHRDVVGEAALRGTEIHSYGEKLVKGESVDIPEEYAGPASAYARFVDRWQIEFVATEAVIGNVTRRYGGRGDLWATIGKRDNAYAYIDLKTGNNVYESTQLQCVAYDNAELWQPEGPESEEPYEPVDLIYVAHILPDDVRMLPVRGIGGATRPGAADFRAFLYVQQVSQWLEAHGFRGEEPLIGAAAHPDRDEDA